ncbi:unnamed protein product, partial [marine sediment metagenome]
MPGRHLLIHLPDFKPKLVTHVMSEVYDWGMLDLNIPQVHKKTMGENIKVGIVDSGKSEHFETIERTKAAENFSSSEYVQDRLGHSTFCAGVVAAGKNAQGVVGVAPKSELYFAKAMGDSGKGDPAGMVRAVRWLIEQKVDIISISAGLFFNFVPLHTIIKRAYKKNII